MMTKADYYNYNIALYSSLFKDKGKHLKILNELENNKIICFNHILYSSLFY